MAKFVPPYQSERLILENVWEVPSVKLATTFTTEVPLPLVESMYSEKAAFGVVKVRVPESFAAANLKELFALKFPNWKLNPGVVACAELIIPLLGIP